MDLLQMAQELWVVNSEALCRVMTCSDCCHVVGHWYTGVIGHSRFVLQYLLTKLHDVIPQQTQLFALPFVTTSYSYYSLHKTADRGSTVVKALRYRKVAGLIPAVVSGFFLT